MSRFFAANYDYESGSSSSEEDLLSSSEDELLTSSGGEGEESDDSLFQEDSESESDVDSDDSDGKPYGPDWFKKPEFRKGGPSGGNKFLKGASYSDSDESDDEGKKVVKSAKEKLLDDMQTVYNKVESAEMTNDWVTILSEFDIISRLLIRAQQQNYGTPNIFVKVLAQFEDAVNATSQQEIKSKAASRAYNTTKQRVKKLARENEQLLEKFRENPEAFDKEPSAELDTSITEGSVPLFGKKSINLSSVASASSEAGFFSALRIVIDSRGKKNVDYSALIKTLEELMEIAKTPYETIMAYLNLVPIRFDVSANLSYQPVDQWKASYQDIMKLLSILEENIEKYQLSELAPKNDFIEDEPEADEHGVKHILGSIFSFVERLDDEFNKSLLNTDPHSSDYLVRLRDEQSVYNLILRTQLYLEATLPEECRESHLARPFVKRLDHIYYKSTKLISIMESNAWKSVPSTSSSNFIPYKGDADEQYVTELVQTLAESLRQQKSGGLRKRAILYQVYFTAFNNNFGAAKEMLINSKIQSHINNSDPSLQILFNRVVVQLGLAAFKLCLIEDCHQVLNELLASSHLREILGQQTLQRISANVGSSSTADEREQLCLPYHKHINLDLIDLVFMTCSLLIEVPQMTAFYSGIKVKRVPYSQKSIRRALEHYDKSSFQGPPESLRDHVLHAAKSMQKGNWAKSIEFLRSVPTWSLLPNADYVLDNLAERVQVESLKTYFFTYKRFYSNISIERFSELFNLPEARVLEVLESVINEYDINAKLNEEKTFVTVEKGEEITKLEEVALKLNKEVKIAKERLNPSSARR
ncbi:probable Eukaryotic translation initiation factor 3 subunit C [Zygosaccharomyces bailii ISA1307]|nr:probable Eukaryotic translation initiation factor 3 subunit C [Zygosaccharomyces bailii ISA1307]